MPVKITTSGTMPGGIVSGITYYIAAGTNASNIKLATTTQNALAGTVVDITNVGTGTHTLNITGTNRTIGQIGGEETHLLTLQELTPHKHQVDDTYGVQELEGVFNNGNATDETNRIEDTTYTGGGQPFNITQPYLALNYIIKY
ncbi:hypothetical protein [Clostridium cellulovorans]|uniref:Tail Collar domain protein n=1 Tax=Clostridium cellulovorans (strain ATCC 35296 / DSM 3052 / OCM 3 / 743B) TaxID=573061 RepID=D9SVZ2_CLOC7|nr:hypothetical protein [Clostridium cellulovorans]ADL53203.1 hypothetical protein Clocel_3527 [Clostridium cellulovorans 743B]